LTVVACLLVFTGFFFIVSGAIGILRLPDFYTRLHAMGKCDTLGVALVVLGLALLEGPTLNGLKILLVIFFIGLANPTATHALGRAAHRAGLVPWKAPADRGSSEESGF
jgi:multicomponent Na+:H+ antiporter subunit G